MSGAMLPIAMLALGVLVPVMRSSAVTQEPPVLCVKQDDCPAPEAPVFLSRPGAPFAFSGIALSGM